MVFSFTFPYVLILIPAVLGLLLFMTVRFHGGQSGFRRYFVFAVRVVVAVLLILSLSGMHVREDIESAATVFTVDLSASFAQNKGRALQLIREAQAFKTEKDSVALVAFGENSVVDAALGDGEITAIDAYVKDGYTNIASALNTASAILPEKSNKRIVLISDGLENADSAVSAAKTLKNRDIEISTYFIGSEIEKEVQLTALNIPKNLNKDVRYDIEAGIYSLRATEARILIYKNNQVIADETVTVRQGDNQFLFTDTADTGGAQRYRAEILPLEDTFIENNTLYAYGFVADAPTVLVIGENRSAEEIVHILDASGVNSTVINAAEASPVLERLNRYQAVILADVPIDSLPDGFDETLETYVESTGGGLIVTGGENSYALGGYYDTALEKVLPVDMQLKDKSDLPNLGMVIVTDRSGSMSMGEYGVSKLALAKEAVIRSVEVLNDGDSIGVLAFDDGYDWAVEMQPLTGDSKAAAIDRIARISDGGGTSILPALREAYDVLKNADTKLKHIILLTDGQAEQAGYDDLLASMSGDAITLSCVAVGSDADRNLLQSLSEKGNGRYYYTDEFTDLPKIFTKETYVAGKTFLNNRAFVPETVVPSPILSDIGMLPTLTGYIATTAKDRADVLLASDQDDPVLAAWQYGLGRSVAWTSDMNQLWSAQWLASDSGVAVFRNAVSWILRKETVLNADISLNQRGKETEIMLTLPFSEGVQSVSGTAVDADNNAFALDFAIAAPGVYQTTIDTGDPGTVIARLTVGKDSGASEAVTMGINIPYAKEYDIRNDPSGELLMRKIAAESGGTVIVSAADVFLPFENNAFGSSDWSTILLILALCLFLFDIAVRRFSGIADAAERALSKKIAGFKRLLRRKTKPKLPLKKNSKHAELNISGKLKKDGKKSVPDAAISGGSNDSKAADTSGELLRRMQKRKGD